MVTLKGITKFRKDIGTRVMFRFDQGKQLDSFGLAHGVITQAVRDDLNSLIAYKVKLDEGRELTLTPTKLIKES